MVHSTRCIVPHTHTQILLHRYSTHTRVPFFSRGVGVGSSRLELSRAVYVVFYTSYFLVQICTTLNLFTFELKEYVCKHERGQFANTNAVVRPNTHIDTANTIAVIANTNAVICPSLIYVT